MQKSHRVIIALAGITVVGIISFTLPHTQQNTFEANGFEIVDLKDSYTQGELVTVSVKYDGKKFDCHIPKIEIVSKTNPDQIIASNEQGLTKSGTCPDSWGFSFYSGFIYEDGQLVPIGHTKSYVASVTLGEKTVRREFTVNPDPDHRFYTEIRIDDLKSVYQVGIPIDFTVTIKGFGVFDVGPMPEVVIEDNSNNTIWSYQNHIVLCCPSEVTELNKELQISRFGEPLIVEKPGIYTIHVTYDHKTLVKKFTATNQYSKNNDSSPHILEVMNLQGNYMPNEKILFYVQESGFGVRCYSASAEIYDSSGNKIWEQSEAEECPPNPGKSDFEQKIPFPEIKLEKPGEYQIVVYSRGDETVRSFSILDPNLVR